MSNATCFDPGTLKDYLLGKLSDEQSDAVAAHLEACLTCEATISQLDRASDTLTNGLRMPATSPEPVTDDELQKALDRVQSLEPATERRESSDESVNRSPVLRDYRLLEPLGSGGMGTVYKAVHTRLDRLVAVKLLPARRLGDEQAVARFQREMRVIGQLSHPAIVQATDAGEVDGTHFLVMEYVEGCDLNTLAKACGPLSIADACEIARQAALGLEYAHQQGIVHRDIKPSNLMLTRGEGRGTRGEASDLISPLVPHPSPLVKILDLGLALLSGVQAPVDELTTVGQLMGTLDYMAPEQLEDSHLVGPRADIYALAATLYRLLTGAAPFAKDDRQTPLQKLRALATQTITPIRERRSDVPEGLAEIIDRALRREPSERFASMNEFAEALASWCAGCDLPGLSQRAGRALPGPVSLWERAGVREPSQVRLQTRSERPSRSLQSGEERQTSARDPHPAFGHPLPGGEGTRPRRNWLVALLALVGFVAVGVVIAIETNKGTLIVESVRDEVEVRVKKSGKIVEHLEITTGSKTTRLAAGDYEIEIVADGLQVQNGKFLLKRGDTVVAKVIEIPKGQAVAAKPGVDGATTNPSPTTKPAEIVDRNAKGMETFEGSNPELAGEKKIREALQQNIDVGFADTPLTDVLLFLEDRTQIKFFLENESLTEEGIAADVPITLSLTDKPTASVLEFLLRPIQCAWYIDGGHVVVTTLAKEKQLFVTRTYPVGRLLPGVRQAVERLRSEPPAATDEFGPEGGFGGGSGGGFYQINGTTPFAVALPLALGQFGGGGVAPAPLQGQPPPVIPTEASHFEDLLGESLGHSWMKREGEGGTCELLHNVFVVRQSRRAHADIEALLRTIEAAFLKPLTEPAEIRSAGYPREADANVRRQLARQLDAAFTDVPVSDVALWLSDQLGVQVWLDHQAFSEEGIASDTPVTLQLPGTTAEVLLSRLTKPLQLAYVVEHGVLILTTASRQKERLVTKVYDVRDLLDRGLHPNRLIAGLHTTTPGPWQSTDGEGGTLTLFSDTLLVVRQTWPCHDEVAKFLTSLRSQLSDQPKVPRLTKVPAKPVTTPTPQEAEPDRMTAANKRLTGESNPNSAQPPSDNQPRYDGKTFDEWLAVLDVERSPARLADAFQALRLLYQDHQAEVVAQGVIKVFRLASPNASFGNNRSILNDAMEALNALPTKVVQTAAANELSNGNTRSRRFVFDFVLGWRGETSITTSQLPKSVLAVSRDADPAIRASALQWLTRLPRTGIGSEAIPDATKRFRESLSDKAPEVAYWAVKGLLDSEPDTAAVVEALTRLMGTPKETSGLNDVSSLQGEFLILAAVMGPRASDTASAIAPFLLLRDATDGNRGFTIGNRGGPGSDQLSIKGLAALALARMGKAAASALPTIEEALKEYGESSRPRPEPRSFGGGFGFNFPAGGSQSPRGAMRLGQVTTLELLLAAKARLEDRPAPDPQTKPAVVKVEDTLPVQAMLKLLQTEQTLLEGHYGPGSERPELRDLDQKLKAVEEEFNTLWKLYNEQRRTGSGAKPEP